MTLTIDFMVLPQVFLVIKDVFLGGRIGSGVFGTFNYVEIILSLLILALIFNLKFSKRWKVITSGLISVVLVFISLVYSFFLTPRIVQAAVAWESLPEGSSRVEMALLHQLYHRWYILTDSFKILLLIFLFFLLLVNQENAKESV